MDGVAPNKRHRKAAEIAAACLPAWAGVRAKDVKASVISGGLTNALWALTPPPPAPPVAARAFGDGSDLLVDRLAERDALAALNPAGFGAAVLAHFPGGRLEELLAARTLTAEDVADPAMAGRVAAGLARLHAAGRPLVVGLSGGTTTNAPPPSAAASHAALFTTMRAWLAMALRLAAVGGTKGGKLPAAVARAAATAAAPTPAPLPPGGALHGVAVADLAAAIDRWEAVTAPLATSAVGGPPVFAHMDLLPGNIMVTDDGGGGENGGGLCGGGTSPRSEAGDDDDGACVNVPGPSNGGGPKDGRPAAKACHDHHHHRRRRRRPPAAPLHPPPRPSDAGAALTPFGPGPGMQFIDFEYARPAPRGFDIGNHWCEWAGLDCEWGRYPSPASRAAWAASYLEEAAKWGSADGKAAGRRGGKAGLAPPSPASVAALVVEGDAYSLASHLWWSTWALVQAAVSPIDFDYGTYAASRFAAFQEREGQVGAEVAGLVGRKRGGGVARLLGCVRPAAVV